MTRKEKLDLAFSKDPELYCDRDKVDNTFGHNPDYLLEVHGLTKSDLIRLERKGLAFKARYETKSGEHRVRWILFKE